MNDGLDGQRSDDRRQGEESSGEESQRELEVLKNECSQASGEV